MNKQVNFDNIFNHGEGNKAVGGVLATNVDGEEVSATYINSFVHPTMTKEWARNEARKFLVGDEDLHEINDEEMAERILNHLAAAMTTHNELLQKEIKEDKKAAQVKLQTLTSMVAVLFDIDFWGVTANLESDGFMSQYSIKNLTKDEYIYCVNRCLTCRPELV